MNSNKKSLYAYIGRFQTTHLGHVETLKYAVSKADKVVVLIGSANAEVDIKNPFTYEERASVMSNILQRLVDEEFKNNHRHVVFDIKPLDDFNNDEIWTKEVYSLVHDDNYQITITGCHKTGDTSTFYLDLFPEWKNDFIEEVNFPEVDVISSTKIRHLFFTDKKIPSNLLPKETFEFLMHYKEKNKEAFNNLRLNFSV